MNTFLSKAGKHADLAAAGAVVLVVVMMIIPLPPFLLDLAITLNISAALMIVTATLYVPRALYASVEVGRMIPEELFEAVAQLLAYVYRVAGAKKVAA